MKPGYLTTEFWLTVVVIVMANLGALEVPEKFRWVVTLGGIVAYAISRGMAKYEHAIDPRVPDNVEIEPSGAPEDEPGSQKAV